MSSMLMQLNRVSVVLMLCVPLSNAVLQVGGSPRPVAEEPVVQVPDMPKIKLGSMGEQLKDAAAAQSFLRTPVGNDQELDATNGEEREETEVSNAGAVVPADSTHTDHGEEADDTDPWEYEKTHDDGTVLTGTNPLENHTLQSLMDDDEDEGDASNEQEPEIPEEWVDPTNGTDEFAYEKAHDDGTEVHGTNPLLAAGFVWEQDALTDDEEHPQASAGEQTGVDSRHPEEADDSAQPGNEVALAADTDEVNGTWESEEEYDDGSVQYGTNPLEHEDEEDDADYDPDHAPPLRSTHTEDDAKEAAMYGNSTHEEEEDDGTVLYGTNPLEETDDEDEELPSNAEVHPGNATKALPAVDAIEA